MCTQCGKFFAGETKIKKHTCRIYLSNPSSDKGFYTKDWFERKKCIRVFDNNIEKEFAVLHSEDCIKKNICTTFTEDFEKTAASKTLMVSQILRPKTTLKTKQ